MSERSLQNLDLDVSRETIQKLEAFEALLSKWTKTINLIAPNTVSSIWERHIIDSAQVYSISPQAWSNWVDLGSGGGLPALVVAILDGGQHPLTLIESDQRKCLFLNTVRRELSLNVVVRSERIENGNPTHSDILSARALAPLPKLFEFTNTHLSYDGIALFSKGETYQDELDAANKNWFFECVEHISITNPASRILEISRIRPRES